jgi:hypothetical protein
MASKKFNYSSGIKAKDVVILKNGSLGWVWIPPYNGEAGIVIDEESKSIVWLAPTEFEVIDNLLN